MKAERLKKLKNVNSRRELPELIPDRVKLEARRKILKQISITISKLPKTETGFSSKSIREDRDHP
jgi:hypothetical protein